MGIEANRPEPDWYDMTGNTVMDFPAASQLSSAGDAFAVSIFSDLRLLVWQRESPNRGNCTGPARARTSATGTIRSWRSRTTTASSWGRGSRRGRVTVWDLPEGTVRWSQPQDVYVWALAVHPTGRFVAVATDNGSQRLVRFLDAGSGVEISRYNWNAGKIPCLAFSHDGLTLRGRQHRPPPRRLGCGLLMVYSE